MKTDDIVNIN